MAKEIQALGATGSTHYTQVIRLSDGKIWNTSGTPAFETYATANIANYAITMTEAGTASGYFTGDFPTAIAQGSYSIVFRKRTGGSPAEADTAISTGLIRWSGTTSVDVAVDANSKVSVPDTQKVDVNTVKTQTVTCSASVTVGAFVGNATAALGVDASGRVDIGKALGTAVTLDTNNVLNVSAKYWAGMAITATSIPVATVAGAAGGLLIAGSNAATTFATWTISGTTTFTGNVSMAAGLNITQSSSNTPAIVVTGNGTGHGAIFTSGSGVIGDGIQVNSASSSGSGFTITATGGNGITVSSSAGTGLLVSGGGTGHGASFTSGSGATGDGLRAIAASTNGNGMTLTKAGSGKDLNATSTNALQVDVNTVKTQGITAGSSITIGAFVGNATALQAIDASGRVDVGKWLGGLIPTQSVTGIPDINVKDWSGTQVGTTNVNGYPVVDVKKWSGTDVTVTTAGTPNVNVTKINNVATTSVTTISAFIGTTAANTAQTGDAYAVVSSLTVGNAVLLSGIQDIGTTVASTGVQLADGAITDAKITFPAEIAGRPTTFLAWVRRIGEWVFNKRTRDQSTGNLVLRNAADTSTLETQVQSTSGTIDTQTKGI